VRSGWRSARWPARPTCKRNHIRRPADFDARAPPRPPAQYLARCPRACAHVLVCLHRRDPDRRVHFPRRRLLPADAGRRMRGYIQPFRGCLARSESCAWPNWHARAAACRSRCIGAVMLAGDVHAQTTWSYSEHSRGRAQRSVIAADAHPPPTPPPPPPPPLRGCRARVSSLTPRTRATRARYSAEQQPAVEGDARGAEEWCGGALPPCLLGSISRPSSLR